MKNAFLTLLLALVSAVAGLAGSEFAARQFIEPVDILQPTLSDDTFLGHRILPGTGGHDDWGYRNSSVPASVDLLAIGDSMTYGVAATRRGSWPSQLSEIADLSTYNLSLGGYGPVQYRYLLEEKGLSLSPRVVIIGLYLGNDMMDAFNLAYSNPVWSSYRDNSTEAISSTDNVHIENSQEKFLGELRQWLAQSSVLYSMLVRSFVGDLVRDSRIDGADYSPYRSFSVHGQITHVNQDLLIAGTDLSDDRVLKGMNITLAALEQIAENCAESGARLLVVVIPTKASVYSGELLSNFPMDAEIDVLLENEERMRLEFLEQLDAARIDVVDPLQELRRASNSSLLYPAHDDHPNEIGYKVIAQVVAKAL